MGSKIQSASLVVAASLIVGAGRPLAAQSLADLAAKEEARRKQIAQPAKVLSNKDLPDVPPVESQPAVPAAAASGSADKAADQTGAKADAGKDAAKEAAGKDAKDAPKEGAKDAAPAKDDKAAGSSKDAPKDQAYWSTRQRDLQTQLDRDQSFADALQTRINVLTADFTARDDPAQRAGIARDRQKALDELDRVKKAIETDRKAISTFQEEARRASVPPGWLR
jgi:hypothetical protein